MPRPGHGGRRQDDRRPGGRQRRPAVGLPVEEEPHRLEKRRRRRLVPTLVLPPQGPLPLLLQKPKGTERDQGSHLFFLK